MTGGAEAVREREFGVWLRSWRHDRRLTQKDLADTLGYDVTYLVKIEGGARPPSRQFLARLSQVAGQPPETLLHASTAGGCHSSLPSPSDTLVGRDIDVERIVSMLTGPARCVTLVGPPGIGKTRLAMEVANRLDARFLSGASWISLLEIQDAGDVTSHIQRALGLDDRNDVDPADAVVNHWRPQHALVVLDNWEHVKAASGFVVRLLTEAPRISVLVTSREPLGLVGEHLYALAPLRVPDVDGGASLDEVAGCAAVELFVTRAVMAWPPFRLTEDNRHAVARACARLDGIPLAIVLAAGLVRTTDPNRIDLTLDEMDAAGVAPVDLPSHQSTLSSAIGWSWSLLDADEQRTFARLAVFAGGCSADAATAVCGTGDSWRHLASLSRQSLLNARPDAPGGPRFEFLATIRAFALARLVESGEAESARQAHLAFFLRFAADKGKGLLGGDQVGCADALAADFENLRAAFDWALVHNPHAALELSTCLWRYLLLRALPTGARWLDQALAAAPAPTPARAAALAAAGSLGWVLGRFDDAGTALDGALALADELGLSDVAALAWLNKGALADQLDRLDEADDCFANALARYLELGDRRGEASALVGQGWISRRRGEFDRACDLWIRSAALFRQVKDAFNEARCLSNLGFLSEQLANYAEATEWMAACRRVQRDLRDVRGLAITEAALGRIAMRMGRHAEAQQRQLDALSVFGHVGEGRRAAESLIVLATLANLDGRHHRAARLLGAAEAELARLGASLADDEDLHAEALAVCRRRLDGGACTRHLAFGRTLSLEDAVALAHDEPNGGRGDSAPASAPRAPVLKARLNS